MKKNNKIIVLRARTTIFLIMYYDIDNIISMKYHFDVIVLLLPF